METINTMAYKFDPEKHTNPVMKWNLNKFYFVVHNKQLIVFEKFRDGAKPFKTMKEEVTKNVMEGVCNAD